MWYIYIYNICYILFLKLFKDVLDIKNSFKNTFTKNIELSLQNLQQWRSCLSIFACEVWQSVMSNNFSQHTTALSIMKSGAVHICNTSPLLRFL